jgi:hypothetical protein
VTLHVLYQNKIVTSFPAHIMAIGRRDAKFGITKRLSFETGAIVRKADLIKHGIKPLLNGQ